MIARHRAAAAAAAEGDSPTKAGSPSAARINVYVRKRPLLSDETKGPRPDFDVLSTASEEVGASLIVHCHVTPLLTPRVPIYV